MQGNDLSNEVVPRFLVVFEDLLGILPSKTDEAKAGTFRRLKQWERLANTYQLNEPIAMRIWDMTMRFARKVEVVTYIDNRMVDQIEDWIDAYEIPCPKVHYFEPDKLARKLTYMPDVAAVFDPNQNHIFKFGHKGRIVNPHTAGGFGLA